MINFFAVSHFHFFPVHSNHPIRAHYGAIGATGAFIRVRSEGIMITFVIDFPGHRNDLGGAGPDTHFTTFAPLNVDYDNSSDFSHLVDIFIF
jgi:hypothetical protein